MKRNLPKIFKNAFLLAALVSCVSLFSACGGEEKKVAVENTSVEKAAPEPTVERKLDDFQENLKSVQNAGFDYIFAFRRQDDAAFAAEDKKFLKENSPPDTNQWRLTADEKAVVAGSNFRFTPEHLAALRTRFAVEDYSVVKMDNNNGNANRNSNVAVGNANFGAKNANQNANAKNKNTQGSFTDN